MNRPSTTFLKARRHSRSGYLYIAVLITTTLVAMIGLAASSVARLELNLVNQSSDLVQAQALARTAVEEAILRIENDPNWRTAYSNNVEAPNPAESVGNGTITFKLVDSDGNLGDDDSDWVLATGIGRVGDATAAESVRLYPTGTPLTCLEPAICCGGDITPMYGADVHTNQFVSSNGHVDASSSGTSIDGSAEAVGSIQGTIIGTQTTGITPRVLPGSDVFEYYKDNGTWIDFSAIPSGTIEKSVLSPASNPYGTTTNPEGIYVVDCEGSNLTIRNTRIVGTLVVLNPGTSSYAGWSIRWDPAVPNYPALLVDGNFSLAHSGSDLSEETHSTNFNPVGTAYGGEEDGDSSDTYPSDIRGLVFINGTFKNTLGGGNPINGGLIAQEMTIHTTFTVDYRSTFKDYPPPGFASGNPMRISPGSWKRATLSK